MQDLKTVPEYHSGKGNEKIQMNYFEGLKMMQMLS